jgi:hypothetical protein
MAVGGETRTCATAAAWGKTATSMKTRAYRRTQEASRERAIQIALDRRGSSKVEKPGRGNHSTAEIA